MKRIVLVSALVGAFAASSAIAQTDAKAAKPARKSSTENQGAGHTAPKPQPSTETVACRS